ncbi:hypothetical protein [Terribacillus sp. JSM ZJ617]
MKLTLSAQVISKGRDHVVLNTQVNSKDIGDEKPKMRIIARSSD